MPGKKWTQDEKGSLIRQANEGRRLPDIRIRTRSPAAVNQQRQRLRHAGLLANNTKRKQRMWTTKEIRVLRQCVNDVGMGAVGIARTGLVNGRSKDSISQQMRRLGLGDPRRREIARSAHRLTPSERAALVRFLRTTGRKLPSAEVAEKFEISPKTVTAYRRRMKLELSWYGARDSERYRRRMKELHQLFIQQTRTHWRKWRAQRRQALENVRGRMEQRGVRCATRQCIGCGENWFATGEFFALTKRRRGGIITHTMSRTCRACRAERKVVRPSTRRGHRLAGAQLSFGR